MKRVLYAVWIALMILVPLFGFWLASSLAAYENASQWLALLVGLLLFPLLPVGWDLVFAWRQRRKDPDTVRKPILTRLDRLVLRTLLVNGLFLGIMMWRAPHTAFRALAVRGDWILDGHDGPIANAARGLLLGLADQFDKRWKPPSDVFGTSDKPPEPTGHHEPVLPPVPPVPPSPIELAQPKPPADPNGWPLAPEADPIVTAMPPEAQVSIEAVGQYLAAHFTDKRQLVKALHDYTVLRLTYDSAALELSPEDQKTKWPSQQANDVFAAKTGVCEGYARLMVALGKAAGVEIAYITGYIRDAHRGADAGTATTDDGVKQALEGFSHAWNAVKIDGSWLLVDATWDDPVSPSGEQQLTSTYLFTPPNLFAFDHLPEEAAWQLVDKPLGAGDFARQPLLNSYIGTLGMSLEQPTRSQITVEGEATIVLVNPFKAAVSANLDNGTDCVVDTTGGKTTLACKVAPGQHEIRMYGAPDAKARSLRYFGSILVNGR